MKFMGTAMLAGSAMALAVVSPAMAQEAKGSAASAARSFSIPSQPLRDALRQLMRQGSLQIGYEAQDVDGRTSAAVTGNMGVGEALSRLLSGTGLSFRYLTPGSVVIERAPQSSDAVNLGPVRVEAGGAGAAGGGVAATLASRDATATENSGSYAPVATSVGKGAQNLRDVPQTVTIITRQRIEDQALRTLDDVFIQAPGVIWQPATTPIGSNAYSRGLAISSARYDGGGPVAMDTFTDTAQFDHVEILRGADGLFSGSGDAGGIVNLARKRPLSHLQVKGLASGGSWNNYRGELDITGPVALDGKVRARLVGVYQDQDYFYRFGGSNRVMIYGSGEVDLTPTTLLFFGGSYQKDKRRGLFEGLPRYSDGRDIGLPRETGLGAPWNRHNFANREVFARIEQKIGKDWLIRASFQQSRRNVYMKMADILGPLYENGTGPYWAQVLWNDRNDYRSFDLNAEGAFSLLGMASYLLIGIDNRRETTNGRRSYAAPIGGDASDLLNPVYPQEPDLEALVTPTGRTRLERAGAYGMVRIKPVAGLSLIGGGRYSFFDTSDSYTPTGALTRQLKQKGVFIPYAGIVYDVSGTVTAYASFAEIYSTQATSLAAPEPGTPLPPVRGNNYEVGLKGEFADGRLTGSIALYRVQKRNEASRDLNFPLVTGALGARCCYVADGFKVSQGFDIDINGELLPGWQISAGYTYNDNSNRRANDVSFSTMTPRHLLKIWTSYAIKSGGLDGLSLGGGVTAQSRQSASGTARAYNPVTGISDGASYSFDFAQPGFSLWSLFAKYRVSENYTLSANINNLFDKTYYRGIDGYVDAGHNYGEPRNFLVSVTMKY